MLLSAYSRRLTTYSHAIKFLEDAIADQVNLSYNFSDATLKKIVFLAPTIGSNSPAITVKNF